MFIACNVPLITAKQTRPFGHAKRENYVLVTCILENEKLSFKFYCENFILTVLWLSFSVYYHSIVENEEYQYEDNKHYIDCADVTLYSVDGRFPYTYGYQNTR